MLIEYKIKLEKNGITITQRVEPGSSGTTGAPVKLAAASAPVVNKAESKDLAEKYSPPETADPTVSESGSGNADSADSGEGNATGNSLGSGLVIVFGPIVFGGSPLDDSGGGNADSGDSGEFSPP